MKTCQQCNTPINKRNKFFCSKKCRASMNLSRLWERVEEDCNGCMVYGGPLYLTVSGSKISLAKYAFKLIFDRLPIGVVKRCCNNSYCLSHLEDKLMRESKIKIKTTKKRILYPKVYLICPSCQVQFIRGGAYYRYFSAIRGQDKFYCSNKCVKRSPGGWRAIDHAHLFDKKK